MISIKRIYDESAEKDGYRILVDRLWPRGVSKEKAALDEWFKDIAPSAELRTWFGHKAERFTKFTALYQSELENNPAVAQLKAIINEHQPVTLPYAAHDPVINHAQVLLAYLQR